MCWDIERPLEYLVGFSSFQEEILEINRRVRWTLRNIDANPMLYGDEASCFVIDLRQRIVHVLAADGSYYYTMPISWIESERMTLGITATQRQQLYDAEPSGRHYFDRYIAPGMIEGTFQVTLSCTYVTVEVDADRQMWAVKQGLQPDAKTLKHLHTLTAHHVRTHAIVQCYR